MLRLHGETLQDVKDNLLADQASQDLWDLIDSFPKIDKVNTCLRFGLITEDEIDVPMSESKFSNNDYTDLLYANSISTEDIYS